VKTQTLGDVQRLLASAGLRPRRRLGQCFLIDGNLLRKLVHASEIRPDDTVIEVGGGTGALTDHLADLAGRVVVLEIDPGLHRVLESRFAHAGHVEIHHQDALDSKHTLGDALRQTVTGAGVPAAVRGMTPATGTGGSLLLVANLPYGIAAPLLMNLLIDAPRMRRLCFTVQREVAQRMASPPGVKAYGPIAVAVQVACRIRRIADVPRQAFWPRPHVDSRMIRLDRVDGGLIRPGDLGSFVSMVRHVFLHRRKTLAYNLQAAMGERAVTLAADLVDGRARPENVTIAQWVALYGRFVEHDLLRPPASTRPGGPVDCGSIE